MTKKEIKEKIMKYIVRDRLLLRLDYDYDKNSNKCESNRIIIALHPEDYEQIKDIFDHSKRYDNYFFITTYNIDHVKYYPKDIHEEKVVLYIPSIDSGDSFPIPHSVISKKLNKIINKFFTLDEEVIIDIPVHSDEGKLLDRHRGNCFIHGKMTLDKLVKFKILMNNYSVFWMNKKKEENRCRITTAWHYHLNKKH